MPAVPDMQFGPQLWLDAPRDIMSCRREETAAAQRQAANTAREKAAAAKKQSAEDKKTPGSEKAAQSETARECRHWRVSKPLHL